LVGDLRSHGRREGSLALDLRSHGIFLIEHMVHNVVKAHYFDLILHLRPLLSLPRILDSFSEKEFPRKASEPDKASV